MFQRYISAIFRDLIRDGVMLLYMDDLLVLAENRKNGLLNLEKVLDTASKGGLIINWNKCCLLEETVEFLGHTIGGGFVQPSEKKTEAVKHFPEPRNV